MKLEVGKKYRTRNGNVVTIVSHDPTIITPYSFSGILDIYKGGQLIACWRADGRYTSHKHHLDILEEVTSEPKQVTLPFSFKKALLGNKIIDENNHPVELISESVDGLGNVCVRNTESKTFHVTPTSNLRLLPVAMIEDEPVLIGDTIFLTDGKPYKIVDRVKEDLLLSSGWLVEIRNVKLPRKTVWANLSRTESNTIIAEEWNSKEVADLNKRATHFHQTSYTVKIK